LANAGGWVSEKMASFSFSFSGFGDSLDSGDSGIQSSVQNNVENAALLPLVEVPCPDWVTTPSFHPGEILLDFIKRSTPTGPAEHVFRLRKVDVDQHPHQLSSYTVPSNHDIVAGKYGGGYKIWECSLDLVQYLLDCTDSIQQHAQHRPTPEYKLLELGCGHGLPGAAALSLFSPLITHAIFSDLNQEVLVDATWPNIRLNSGADTDSTSNIGTCHTRCVSGDWKDFSSWVGASATFDLILSAETLYNEDNCRALVTLLHALLSPTGVAILANKRYYFGVGGGTISLENAISASSVRSAITGTKLQCAVVKSFEDGASNIRDIIEVKWTE